MPAPQTFCINRTRASWKRDDGTINLVDLLRADEPKVLERVVLSSYCLELEWLFNDVSNPYAPASVLHKVKELLLVHSSATLQQELIHMAAALKPQNSEDDDVVEVLPPLYQMLASKQLQTHVPPLPIEYGTMHVKLILMYYADSVRVAITTANLQEHDWSNLIQCIWTQLFPLRTAATVSNDFEVTLLDLLKRMQLQNDAKRLAQYDFSSATVHLISSGNHFCAVTFVSSWIF